MERIVLLLEGSAIFNKKGTSMIIFEAIQNFNHLQSTVLKSSQSCLLM